MPTVIAEIDAIDLDRVRATVGRRSFGRGREYAREGRVLSVAWDGGTATLTGSVRGEGAVYETAAFFGGDRQRSLKLDDGECTCPVGYNCKHVAAIAIAARMGVVPGHQTAEDAHLVVCAAPGAAVAPSSTAVRRSDWEDPLRALLASPSEEAQGVGLAIELALSHGGLKGAAPLRLTARLMRPGARGGWINGSLAFSALEPWRARVEGWRADHLALARELYAVHRAGGDGLGYRYSYGNERTLDLSACESLQLWPLLERARRIGMKLVHAAPAFGELPEHIEGELAIDVRAREEGGSLAHAVLLLGEDAAASERGLRPVLFLGTGGHGLVCVEDRDGRSGEPERRPLQLVALRRPVPGPLQRMLLAGEAVGIPADGMERFASELCPALQRLASVISSDGSFAPPELSAPQLALRAIFLDGDQRVQVGWEWLYRVGDRTLHARLAAEGAGTSFRDLEAERAILAETFVAETGIEHLGLLDERARPAGGPPVLLSGLDAMRLATEQLPRLAERYEQIAVEIVGEPPDYRDVSHSLAIGVSATEIAGERDWFDLGVSISVEGRELPFAEVFSALARGESQLMLADGAYFSLVSEKLQELRRLIEEARSLTDTPSSSLRISRYQAGLWAELAALGVVREQAQSWQRQVEALLGLDALAEQEPPAGIDARLRPYQLDGFGWLAALWDLGLGGILADDMGLGKTLQVLALICHARERDPGLGPFLVVAPTSVVPGWVSEAARFARELEVRAVTDTLAKCESSVEELAAADVVVTTYTLFRLDFDSYKTVAWAGLALDEAQYVKNHQAKTYRCVRELAAPFKLAITGTPMENSLSELWALLSIVAPGLFPDPKRFAEQYVRPIERGGDAERLARLRRRIKPLIKRRSKELVAAELPAKQEQALQVQLHPRHRKIYDRRLQRERQKILGLLGDFHSNRFEILRSITLLRQLALHPGLIDGRNDTVPCAKLGALTEQLADVIGGGHRALVFSQFTGFLARARERLDEEGIGYCYLDGRTRRRDRVIDRFKGGVDPVFLISLKAGGFGLNLTEADYCFLLDPWWNPAVEAQAIDRTHRIGQSRQVMVYRLLARGTIEEKVAALAARKAALFNGVMDEGDLFASAITAEDVRGLLG